MAVKATPVVTLAATVIDGATAGAFTLMLGADEVTLSPAAFVSVTEIEIGPLEPTWKVIELLAPALTPAAPPALVMLALLAAQL